MSGKVKNLSKREEALIRTFSMFVITRFYFCLNSEFGCHPFDYFYWVISRWQTMPTRGGGGGSFRWGCSTFLEFHHKMKDLVYEKYRVRTFFLYLTEKGSKFLLEDLNFLGLFFREMWYHFFYKTVLGPRLVLGGPGDKNTHIIHHKFWSSTTSNLKFDNSKRQR